MNSIPVNTAKERLPELLNEVMNSHNPIEIVDNENSAVLLSSDDWKSVQETLYLLSVPGMRESIREGMQTPTVDCSENLW